MLPLVLLSTSYSPLSPKILIPIVLPVKEKKQYNNIEKLQESLKNVRAIEKI